MKRAITFVLVTLLIVLPGFAAQSNVRGSESTISRDIVRAGPTSTWQTSTIITIEPERQSSKP